MRARERWLALRGWQPFPFQRKVWKAMSQGTSRLPRLWHGAGAHCRHRDGDEFSIRSHKRATAQSHQVVNTTIVNSVIIDSIPITTL